MDKSLEKYFKQIDALFISSIANIVYLTGYSGFSETERECFLLFTKSKKYLITDKRYSESLKKQIKDFEIIDIGAINFLSNDHTNILKDLRLKIIGIEENDLKVSELRKLRKFINKTKNIDLSSLRIIKNDSEIKNIKKACSIGDKAFSFILKRIKIGISEKQLSQELELFIKSQNADISFKPIVAFGKNSSVPHHQTGETKLLKNQIVLLDLGVKINNYCSDMTRTVFFGEATDKFKQMHKTALSAQQKAIEFVNSSIKAHHPLIASEIDKVSRDFIINNNYPNIIHSVGHGIGVEVHESPYISPNSKNIISEGMVFSIEPGIYIPDFGGVRIEDLILITKNGAQLISHSNREIIEISLNNERDK